MTELGNLFDTVDEEKKLYFDIKAKMSGFNVIESRLLFNYHLYTAIYFFHKSDMVFGHVRKCLRAFIAKEENLAIHIAVINNMYQIASMMDKDFLVSVLSGQQSNLLVLNSDAAKLGALIALNFKVHGTKKLDLLKETLFLS